MVNESLIALLQEELDATYHLAAEPETGTGGLTYADGLLRAVSIAEKHQAEQTQYSLRDRIAMTESALNPSEPTEAMVAMSERFLKHQAESLQDVVERVYNDPVFFDAAFEYKTNGGALINVAKAAIEAMGSMHDMLDMVRPVDPANMVERVANAIHDVWHTKGSTLDDIARAAIFAMGAEPATGNGKQRENASGSSAPATAIIEKLQALKAKYCPDGIFDKNWRYSNGIDDAISILGESKPDNHDPRGRKMAVGSPASYTTDSGQVQNGFRTEVIGGESKVISDEILYNALWNCMMDLPASLRSKMSIHEFRQICEIAKTALNPYLRTTGPGNLLDPEMSSQELRLHMGELTAQEERTARAAIRWANTRQPTPVIGKPNAAEALAKAILEAHAKWQAEYQGVGHAD